MLVAVGRERFPRTDFCSSRTRPDLSAHFSGRYTLESIRSARFISLKRVIGLGGIFFKSDNPQALYSWYEKHLGIRREPHGEGVLWEWRAADQPETKGANVWSIFPRDTKYFQPSQSSFMINYRVDDLNALLSELNKEGVEIDPHREDYNYGRFAWVMDPEGNRVELWELPKGQKK